MISVAHIAAAAHLQHQHLPVRPGSARAALVLQRRARQRGAARQLPHLPQHCRRGDVALHQAKGVGVVCDDRSFRISCAVGLAVEIELPEG
jgi:hypothetical protein